MTEDRKLFEKILAIAVNPGAIEGEASAALHRARELVKKNPALAHPPPPPPPAAPKPQFEPQATFSATITTVHPDWLLILVSLLSLRAYELGVKYQIDFDFTQIPVAVKVLCDGSVVACNAFELHVTWCVNYINEQLKKN